MATAGERDAPGDGGGRDGTGDMVPTFFFMRLSSSRWTGIELTAQKFMVYDAHARSPPPGFSTINVDVWFCRVQACYARGPPRWRGLAKDSPSPFSLRCLLPFPLALL